MAYELIETVELTSSSQTVTITSIPQDGVDLEIKISARSTDASFSDTGVIAFNGYAWDSGNMQNVRLVKSSTIASASASNSPFYVSGSGSTSSTNGNTSIYIANYATANPKSFSTDAVMENNSATDYRMGIYANQFTPSEAITSITFDFPDSESYVAGSTFSLYKIY